MIKTLYALPLTLHANYNMVIIILGSKSDLDWGKEIGRHLTEFNIPYIMHIASAHKTPEYLITLIDKYESLNKQLIYICVAGRSNALGGFVDARTANPVINCPPYTEKYKGLDILSSLRMPSGVVPLTVITPEAAALAAAKIFGSYDKKIKKKILAYQEKNRKKIISDDQKLIIK